ncbi:MAG TPA: OmpA family protein [Pyrinomonadaceae bacterium]|nr:OmpA family protein [Pyrinomonadaceae bacterium]
MLRRANPWPAYADLFSALLIATFAGFMMLSAAYQYALGRYEKAEQEVSKVRQQANNLVTSIQRALSQENAMAGHVRPCGEDTCIDFYIHFKTSDDRILRDDEKNSLGLACSSIKNAIDHQPPDQRKDIEITIEGHTDSQQPQDITDPRELYLYNWNLSGRRATSVLYEFQKCGLAPPDYRVVAIGYADSKPLCSDTTKECLDSNRRTTLSLHADTKRIEERLKGADQTTLH